MRRHSKKRHRYRPILCCNEVALTNYRTSLATRSECGRSGRFTREIASGFEPLYHLAFAADCISRTGAGAAPPYCHDHNLGTATHRAEAI